MSNKMKRITLAMLLVLAMVLSFAACDGDPAKTTDPDTTTDIPETTDIPKDTDPVETDPDGTEPVETLPDETLPEETKPAETDPEDTTPEETKPAETKPEDEKHVHTYNLSYSMPTCTEDGVYRYTCACGTMYDELGDKATGHYWRFIETVDSTCTVAGTDTYKCDICDEVDERPLALAAHSYTISTALVTPAEDPRGEGYELLGCDMCTLMAKVTANSASGHNFITGADGVAKCGCGTIGIPVESTVVALDFEEGSEAKINGLVTSPIEDGKWRASDLANNQPSIHKTNVANIVELMGGTYEGEKFANFEMSFELSFTGKLPSNSGAFVSWRTAPVGKVYQEELNITLSPNGDKLQISSNNGKADLAANKTYVVTITVTPSNNGMVATVEGEGLAAVTLFDGTSKAPVNEFLGIWFRCNAIRQDKSVFALYIDNLTFETYAQQADETNITSEPCEHSFTSVSVVDDAHPAAELWCKDTCSKCERYYYKQECAALGGHVWGEPVIDPATSCLEQGTETYSCLVCGETEIKDLPITHVYSAFAGIYAAEDDAAGVGYEFYACACGEMTKIVANHESGHYFDENNECTCGATAIDKVEAGIISFDFESVNAVNWTHNAIKTENLVDGKWLVSSMSSQPSLSPARSPKLVELLSGEYNGKPVAQVKISMDVSYTGMTAKTGEVLISWRSQSEAQKGTTSYYQEIAVKLEPKGDKIALVGNVGEAVLDASVAYTLTATVTPESDKIVFTVEGEGLEATVIAECTTKNPMEAFYMFVFRGNNFEKDANVFALYIDNLSVDRVAKELDLSDAPQSCEHSFESESISDETHPADEMWYKDTCSKCGNFYYRQDCSLLGGHVFGKTPVVVPATSCLEQGTEIYYCLACGAEDVQYLPTAHVYSAFAGIVSAEDDPYGVGYEYLACACGEMKKFTANHTSGHYFDDTNKCACGATAQSVSATLGSRDFSSTSSSVPHFGTGESKLDLIKVGDDYKWRASTQENVANKNQQFTLYPENNPAIVQLLSGQYNGNPVSKVEVVFELSYTGTASFAASYFASFRTKLATDTANTDEFNLYLSSSNGKVVVTNTNTTLEPDVDYTVTLSFVPATNAYVATLSGGSLGTVTLAEGTTKKDLEHYSGLCFRSNAYVMDPATCALYVDDLAINYTVQELVDDSMATGACAHSFTVEPLEGTDDQFTYTCSKCERFYYGPAELMRTAVEVVTLDFADSTSVGNAELKIANLTKANLSDGKWKVTSRNGQYFIRSTGSSGETANATLTQLLTGKDADENTVDRVEITFDFSYTGGFAPLSAQGGNNRVFMNFMQGSGFIFSLITEETSDGKILLYEAGTPNTSLLLEADKTYTVKLRFDIGANQITLTVAQDGAETVQLSKAATKVFSEAAFQIGIARDTLYCADGTYDLYIDNLTLSYDKIS